MTSQGLYRSSVVAQLAGMPVATLRVWERRYMLGCAERQASGRRLYSRDDVQRIVLLKQLTERGHGIGALVRLDLPALQALGAWPEALPEAAAGSGRPNHAVPAPGWMLVGSLPPPMLDHLALSGLRLLGQAADLFQALNAPVVSAPGSLALLLAAVPGLDGVDPLQLRELAARHGGGIHLAVVYRLGAASDRARWAALGVHLLQEPREPGQLLGWVQKLLALPAPPAIAQGSSRASSRAARALDDPAIDARLPQRRYGEQVLRRVAAMPSGVACECPGHVAELLLQLSHFEDYSARCMHRSPEDAELHADLRRAAATARSIFEMALERVAAHEGLDLGEVAR